MSVHLNLSVKKDIAKYVMGKPLNDPTQRANLVELNKKYEVTVDYNRRNEQFHILGNDKEKTQLALNELKALKSHHQEKYTKILENRQKSKQQRKDEHFHQKEAELEQQVLQKQKEMEEASHKLAETKRNNDIKWHDPNNLFSVLVDCDENEDPLSALQKHRERNMKANQVKSLKKKLKQTDKTLKNLDKESRNYKPDKAYYHSMMFDLKDELMELTGSDVWEDEPVKKSNPKQTRSQSPKFQPKFQPQVQQQSQEEEEEEEGEIIIDIQKEENNKVVDIKEKIEFKYPTNRSFYPEKKTDWKPVQVKTNPKSISSKSEKTEKLEEINFQIPTDIIKDELTKLIPTTNTYETNFPPLG